MIVLLEYYQHAECSITETSHFETMFRVYCVLFESQLFIIYMFISSVDFPPLVTSEYITPPVEVPSDMLGFDHVSIVMMR